MTHFQVSQTYTQQVLLVGKKCKLWPQTIRELLADLHEEFKANIQHINQLVSQCNKAVIYQVSHFSQ